MIATFINIVAGLSRVQKIIAVYSTKFPIIVRRLDPETKNYEVSVQIKGEVLLGWLLIVGIPCD